MPILYKPQMERKQGRGSLSQLFTTLQSALYKAEGLQGPNLWPPMEAGLGALREGKLGKQPQRGPLHLSIN